MTEQIEGTNCKRRRLQASYRWTDVKTRDLLEAVVDEIKDNAESFEKPTAQQFYRKIGEKAPSIGFINWQTMKSRIRYLKSSFMVAGKWKSQTGAGLLADGNEKSVSEYIAKICPYWTFLEQVFGSCSSIYPSVIYETSSGITPENHISFDSQADNFDVSNNSLEGINSPIQISSPPECSPIRSGISRSTFRTQIKDKTGSNSISLLVSIQEKRLNLEKMKWEQQLEMDTKQFEFKRLELEKEMEIKKLEMEKDERIAMAKIKLEIESQERLRKYELNLKQNGNQS